MLVVVFHTLPGYMVPRCPIRGLYRAHWFDYSHYLYSSFVEHEREMTEVKQVQTDNKNRLLTLVDPGMRQIVLPRRSD